MENIEKPKIRKQTAGQEVHDFLESPEANLYFLNSNTRHTLHGLAGQLRYKEIKTIEVKEIEEYTKLSKNSILRGLKDLEKMELIKIIRTHNRASEYSLTLPELSKKSFKDAKKNQKGDNFCE